MAIASERVGVHGEERGWHGDDDDDDGAAAAGDTVVGEAREDWVACLASPLVTCSLGLGRCHRGAQLSLQLSTHAVQVIDRGQQVSARAGDEERWCVACVDSRLDGSASRSAVSQI